MDSPTIYGKDALHVIAHVPDNGERLVIMGDHPKRWDDFFRVPSTKHCDIMAVNNAAYGAPVEYMATMHSAEWGDTSSEFTRRFDMANVHDSTLVIGQDVGGCHSLRIDMTIKAEPLSGTSALFAVIAGLVLGYKDIWLCGVRLEKGTPYYNEHIYKAWTETWQPVFAGHVHATAGWLKEHYV